MDEPLISYLAEILTGNAFGLRYEFNSSVISIRKLKKKLFA